MTSFAYIFPLSITKQLLGLCCSAGFTAKSKSTSFPYEKHVSNSHSCLSEKLFVVVVIKVEVYEKKKLVGY